MNDVNISRLVEIAESGEPVAVREGLRTAIAYCRVLAARLAASERKTLDLMRRNRILRTRPDLPMTHEDKAKYKELEQRLAEAERHEHAQAQDLGIMACKVVELEKQLAEAQATVARQQDRIDLQCDEFQRIAAIAGNDEIKGLCDRAVKDIRQHVPVIQQRDQAEQQVARLRKAVTLALDYYRSKGTQKYNPYEVEQSLEQALRETGAGNVTASTIQRFAELVEEP